MIHPHDRAALGDVTSSADEVAGDAQDRAVRDSIERNRELLGLLDRGPDALVDALCDGVPEDFLSKARRHLTDHAYFLDPRDLAAKVIAQIAMLAGVPHEEATLVIDDVLETATARALELEGSPALGLMGTLSSALGVDRDVMPALCTALNGYELRDRRVLYSILVLGVPVAAYCERYDEDRSVVEGMIGVIQRYAVGLSANARERSVGAARRKSDEKC